MARNRAAEYQRRNAAAQRLGFDTYAHQRSARAVYKQAFGHGAPRDADLRFMAKSLTGRRSTDREIRLSLRIDPHDRMAWTAIFSP